MFISGRMHINNLLYARRILMNFLMYLFWRRKGWGGGVTNACICMGTHSLSYRTDWWMLTELGRDEEIMALHLRLGFSAKSTQRWIQVGVLFIVCAYLMHLNMEFQGVAGSWDRAPPWRVSLSKALCPDCFSSPSCKWVLALLGS